LLKRDNQAVDKRFEDYRKEINEVHTESMKVLEAQRFQTKLMATKVDVEYVIEKTRIMCD